MRSLSLWAATLLALITLTATALGQAGGPSPVVAPQNNTPGDGARRITPAEVRAALDKNEAVIVDVRGQSSYEAGHVKGALSIPYLELLSRLDELPRDKMIVTYCS